MRASPAATPPGVQARTVKKMTKEKELRAKTPLLSLSLLFVVVGCAAGLHDFPAIDGIGNFGRVNHSLYRGGQPNNLGIQSLKRLGIKTIVNLRMTNDLCVTEETEARANGIIYTNVPMRGLGRPTDKQVVKVLSVIETSPSPVFIHCEHGRDRTGTIIACYRIKHDQWTSKLALNEAGQYGMSNWELGMKNYVVDFDKSCNRPKEQSSP